MAAQVLSFFQRSPRYAPTPSVDWTQQELAEFYRVESALIRAGIRVGTDRGLSDENEPWFVFYRSDDGEVVIHFARIDGEYLIAGPAYEEIARGFDFSALVRNMVARHPLIRRADNNSNLSIHPAALLVAVVGTAFFKTGEARAAETGAANPPQSGHARPALLSSSSNAGLTNGVAPVGFQQPTYDSVQVPANQAVLILAAALLASDYGVDTASLDASARAAISAAAASLDFGGAPAQHSQDSSALLMPTTHATVIENTPVQTVSSVLSLVAILSTMPQLEASASEGMIGGGGGSGGGNGGGGPPSHGIELSPLPAPTSDAANWALDVRLGLSLSGLPSVEAVQLIRGLAGDTGAQKISVIEVAKLPDILAELISKGDHYAVTPPSAPAAPAEPVVTTPVAETPAAPPQDSLTSTPTPTEPTDTAPIQTPVAPTPIPTPAPLPAAPTSPFVSSDLVKQFIDYFMAHTMVVEVMVQGTDIVMFDARILHDASAATHLTSMTFDFADGGSISLVGNHSSFLNDGNLV
ncbi:hypothetical protein [Caulobacter sp.]|uniref:hypothetical protein n=1 Tax=Caulobacter sp. TaxID=78 RepID=UPI001B1EFA03|nr:hypothetical protein [Caulobacter sp.]MBO9544845.1 hypothetical protein [Caulobacter sp.]